jgi:hypothetical protein
LGATGAAIASTTAMVGESILLFFANQNPAWIPRRHILRRREFACASSEAPEMR